MGITGTRGKAAEIVAAAYLELAGLRVDARNVRLGGVEVDLLATDRDVRVVVEVKFRSRSDYGGALLTIDRSKRERLRRAASVLVAAGARRVRIDVVGLELVPDGALLRHVRDAVTD
jgi:putative endonuclease